MDTLFYFCYNTTNTFTNGKLLMDKHYLLEAFFDYMDKPDGHAPYNIDLRDEKQIDLFLKMRVLKNVISASEDMYVLNETEHFKQQYESAIHFFKLIDSDEEFMQSFKTILFNRLTFRKSFNRDIISYVAEKNNIFEQKVNTSLVHLSTNPLLYAISCGNLKVAEYLLEKYDVKEADYSQNKALFKQDVDSRTYNNRLNITALFFERNDSHLQYLSPEFIYIHTIMSFSGHNHRSSLTDEQKREFFTLLPEKLGEPTLKTKELILSLLIKHEGLNDNYYPFTQWDFNVNKGKAIDTLMYHYDFSDLSKRLTATSSVEDENNDSSEILFEKICLYKDVILKRLEKRKEYFIDSWINNHMLKHPPKEIDSYISFIKSQLDVANAINLFLYNEPLKEENIVKHKKLVIDNYISYFDNKFFNKKRTPEYEKNYLNGHIALEEMFNKDILNYEQKKVKRL